MRLLIVDDNEQVRRLIKNLVSDIADEVVECGDGMLALTAYDRCRPDLVLMDIRMEQMDGLTATVQIREAFPQARILIVSNYDDRKLRQTAAESGACGYVTKDNLLEIRNYLAH